MKKKTNKAKLEFFKFWRKSVLSQGYKIGGNYALPTNSIQICLLGYFCMQNSICDENSSNSYDFHENAKNRKMNNYGNFCKFFKIFTETLEQNIRKSQKICFLDGKKTNKAK